MTVVISGMLIAEPMLHLEDKLFKNKFSLEAITPEVPSMPHTDPRPPIDTTYMFHQNHMSDSSSFTNNFYTIKIL